MLSSILLLICVALNAWLIWICLAAMIGAGVGGLTTGLLRTRLYFKTTLTRARERALRRRTWLLLRQTGLLALVLVGGAVLYLPSMLFACYRSSLSDAFVSPEALAGMLSAVAIGWRRRKT